MSGWHGAPGAPEPAGTAGRGVPAAGTAPLDADAVADAVGGGVPAVVAVVAVATWLGEPARTRHREAARRAADMTASIAGARAPALTVRGLA